MSFSEEPDWRGQIDTPASTGWVRVKLQVPQPSLHGRSQRAENQTHKNHGDRFYFWSQQDECDVDSIEVTKRSTTCSEAACARESDFVSNLGVTVLSRKQGVVVFYYLLVHCAYISYAMHYLECLNHSCCRKIYFMLYQKALEIQL